MGNTFDVKMCCFANVEMCKYEMILKICKCVNLKTNIVTLFLSYHVTL